MALVFWRYPCHSRLFLSPFAPGGTTTAVNTPNKLIYSWIAYQARLKDLKLRTGRDAPRGTYAIEEHKQRSERAGGT